jgi:DNA adenine methylase
MLNNTKPVTKPFLKWVGGKTQIIDDVLALFPRKMVNYHEPFLGGGSVLLAFLSHVKYKSIEISGVVYASDLNANLIHLYKVVQSKPDELIAELNKLMDEFSLCPKLDPPEKKQKRKVEIVNEIVNESIDVLMNETDACPKPKPKRISKPRVVKPKATTLAEALTSQEMYYYWIRAQFNELTSVERATVRGSAMMLFMNKTCFRGVHREGPNGFNVPFGNYQNPLVFDEEHIRLVSTLVKDVKFSVCPFSESLNNVKSGDFVYLDPPYASPESEKMFVAYTSVGFSLAEHKLLFGLCAEFSKDNVRMLMSNAYVDFVKDNFPAPTFTTKVVVCRRAIHSLEPDSKTNEVLITNF